MKQEHLCRFSHPAVSLDYPQCLRSSVCATVYAQQCLRKVSWAPVRAPEKEEHLRSMIER